MASKRIAAKGKANAKAVSKPDDKARTKASKPSAAGPKRPKAPLTNGSTEPAGLATTSSASGKRRHDAPASRDTAPSKPPPSKKAKSAPAPTPTVSKKPVPPKVPPKRVAAKASRPVRIPADAALPIINQVPAEVLTVLVFGSGANCELGLGPTRTETSRPITNPFLSPKDESKFHVVQLACGGMHVVALTRYNKIITWGVNDHYALGRDTRWDSAVEDPDDEYDLNPRESTPTEIPQSSFPRGTVFVQVAAGDSCSFALTDTGLVYGWGTFRNSNGAKQFGYSDGQLIDIQRTPALIPGLNKITQVVCGENHALALDAVGQVWGWGVGECNELGRRPFGRYQDTLSPRHVRICRTPVRYIASGEHHSFAVDSKDDVWAWGLNSFGEAGDAKTAGGDSALTPYPMKIPDLCGKGVTVLDGGSHHSVAVTRDGQCLVWGRIDGGQLGIEFTAEQLDDGTLVRHDDYGKPRVCLRPALVPIGGGTLHAGCGTDHTIFISREGKGYATGYGALGQLGLGDDEDQTVAKEMTAKSVKDKVLTWAAAGGQFSVIATRS